jgi:hypothetical protein
MLLMQIMLPMVAPATCTASMLVTGAPIVVAAICSSSTNSGIKGPCFEQPFKEAAFYRSSQNMHLGKAIIVSHAVITHVTSCCCCCCCPTAISYALCSVQPHHLYVAKRQVADGCAATKEAPQCSQESRYGQEALCQPA